jgi:glycosyltransferase involved in cell wall biosynthesis
MPPRVHVAYPVADEPSGGGNQFMRALTREFGRRGALAADARSADVVLFASYHGVRDALALRRANPGAVFLHRVDGPMRLYNRMDDPRDALVIEANALLADATVFQSEWCRRANRELGWHSRGPEAVIGNAADPAIFRPRDARPPGRPLRAIAASWSSNPNKGFDVYEWLDARLDPADVAMTFVGNAPAPFRRIRSPGPLDDRALAAELAAHDVYITASRKDPCSNSLIEALTVGLPAVARADGGHPEILGEGGVLFEAPEAIPALLARIAADYGAFRDRIRVPTIASIAGAYLDFAGELLTARRTGRLPAKRPGVWALLRAAIRFRGR